MCFKDIRQQILGTSLNKVYTKDLNYIKSDYASLRAPSLITTGISIGS